MRREDAVSWPGRLRGGLYTYSNICSSYVTVNVLSVLRPVILCHAVSWSSCSLGWRTAKTIDGKFAYSISVTQQYYKIGYKMENDTRNGDMHAEIELDTETKADGAQEGGDKLDEMRV